ncbi:3'-5' exonuclease [Melghirimyces algeriensis]|uniref:Exonuclease n=1 Tax=Melghirimyces algeriensis TaxID=910412 RepID=A0A521FIA7_9BACL|nr:3'-5' exonuclease [Melghirimyces algeriensis]SMO95947.1 Exonuclease [Melghirimyces algeriensis]
MTYIIFDLETTCEEKRRVQNETIEIGAVKVDEAGQAVDTFQTFVRPVIRPVLSGFCTQLTTIRQKEVDTAPFFPQAVASFRRWIGEEAYMLCSWGFYVPPALFAP